MLVNLSHYCFFLVKDPTDAVARLQALLSEGDCRGTVLVSSEGVNFNLSGPEASLKARVLNWLGALGCPDLEFRKISFTAKHTFKRLKIRVKPEIVSSGLAKMDTRKWRGKHIPSKDFRRLLADKGEALVIDMRNDFEYQIGTFAGAIPAGTQTFREWADKVETLKESIPLDYPITMFCTGGIRCEKASAIMRLKGFKNVFQLEGGILHYFENEGGAEFKGDCFVFDERVAVDGNLKPVANVGRCPKTGVPIVHGVKAMGGETT